MDTSFDFEKDLIDEAGDEDEEDIDDILNGLDVDDDEGEDDDDDDEADTDAKQSRQFYNEEDWVPVDTRKSLPPKELLVTHVNQTKDLMRVKDVSASYSENQHSGEWLASHSIDALHLTIQQLVDKGKVGNPAVNKETGKLSQHIQFEAQDINEFEYKLHMSIETYTKRIKWLLQGSKRTFGMVKGNKVAVCIDTSDANTGFGRLSAFQDSLMHLIDEQLSKKKSLYMVGFGSDVNPLWEVVRDVNCRTVEEAKQFVMGLRPSGGCNLLKAMKQIMKLKDINSILLVLGSVPDQSSEILCDFVNQMGAGKEIPLHTVAYDCSNHLTNLTLRKLADESGGRYHCYTATCEEQIYTGTDISVLLKEIQKAQDVINKIKEMRQGMMGSALVSILNEISLEVAKLPQSRFLPRPPGHDHQLKISMPKFHPSSSADWLSQHGLKAKSLDLYQVLAPNAYSYKEEFIPVIRKTVISQVHEKAMAQFQWHDGSMKNIHVDMSQLFEYQKQLGAGVKLYEKRVNWLSSSSRKIFGTIVDKNLVILVDLSISNVNYLVHIQHSVRLLLEQQMANKGYFNIIGFGSQATAWKQTMMKVTEDNLQKAWKWVLDMQCSGSRNFMSALRLAVENDEEKKHHIEVEGIYLFTSGIPDQPADVICQYVEESVAGRDIKLHSVLFNVDDYDNSGAIPGRYANITKTADALRTLAHCSNGRFHWFRETGIIESDDISLVSAEIERAINFSKKCAMLVDSVKRKYGKKIIIRDDDIQDLKPITGPQKLKALLPPKPTALSLARQMLADKDEEKPRSRPSSAKKELTVSIPQRRRPHSAKDPMLSVRSNKKLVQSAFYTEDRTSRPASYGVTFKKYPGQRSVRKSIPTPVIPSKEDQVTSKEWLKMYSLNKLKLDLDKLVSGPDCKHVEKQVKSLHRHVSAKYCTIFPSVNVRGTIKHLQLLPHELNRYEEVLMIVLKRYLRRLQWLLSGSRRVFGTVAHRKCMILVDTSGSMEGHMGELKKELASLIWDQLHSIQAKFNLIRFSGSCEVWQDQLLPATDDNCHNGVRWVSTLRAGGNTCTLDALELAFMDNEVESVYLLTDGKPDNSTAMVLREVARMNADRHIVVNTISFNCSDSTANNFLKLLAVETGGRYHRCHSEFDAEMFAHKILSEGVDDVEYPHLPDFEGDDLRRLGAEIAQARRFLAQARQYRSLIEKHSANNADQDPSKNDQTQMPARPMFVVGRPRSAKY